MLIVGPVLRRLAGVALVAGAGSAGLIALSVPAAPPAAADACSADTGVTVVVDFNQLAAGHPQGTCVSGGGGATARSLFRSAGFAMQDAQRQPGFVCRVNQLPDEDRERCVNTPPGSAYWGLWWSRGDAGAGWVYASEGVDSLNVPDGGMVAFAWDQQSGNVPPDADPVRPSATEPAPSPSPSPSQQPSPPPTGGGGGSAGGGHGAGGHGGEGCGSRRWGWRHPASGVARRSRRLAVRTGREPERDPLGRRGRDPGCEPERVAERHAVRVGHADAGLDRVRGVGVPRPRRAHRRRRARRRCRRRRRGTPRLGPAARRRRRARRRRWCAAGAPTARARHGFVR